MQKTAFWKMALLLALCLGMLSSCAGKMEAPSAPQEEGCCILIAREGVREISVALKDSGGGVVRADGAAFEEGERVYLEQITEVMDLQGAQITVLDENAEVIHRISWDSLATVEDILALAEDSWLIIPEDFPLGDAPQEPPAVSSTHPITADYATAEFARDHVYETAETEYVTYMDIRIHEDLTDVSFGMLNWDGEELLMEKPLFAAPVMKAGDTFLAAVVFYGDMTTYGVSFTDTAGERRDFSLVISGRDGSLQCLEY